jgi:lysophospholipid acyltransferase (LPLAT)-like uncharacterized protein
MNFRKLKQDSLRIIGYYVLSHAVDLLCKTLRVTMVNKDIIDKLESENQNYILAFWHGTMLLPWFLQKGKNFSALVSQSKDGELLSRILKKWDYEVVRGSSHKGGEVALGIMVDLAKNKKSIAITPDGPRGPVFKMKAGAVITAKKAQVPLVLVGAGYKKKRVLKTWDSFQVPKFFSKAKVVYDGPYCIAPELDYDATGKMISTCEQRCIEIQKDAGIFLV